MKIPIDSVFGPIPPLDFQQFLNLFVGKPLSNHSSWVTAYNGLGFNVLHNMTVVCNDRTISNRDSRHNGDVRSNPDIVSNANISFRSRVSFSVEGRKHRAMNMTKWIGSDPISSMITSRLHFYVACNGTELSNRQLSRARPNILDLTFSIGIGSLH